jgi:host factor-I protein
MMDHRRPHRPGPKPPFSGKPREDRPRGAPPDATGAETNYIVKNMEARTPMVVHLMNNQEVRGWIEYYDRDVIKINRAQPPHLLIRKDSIKYMYKDEAAKAPAPREKD